MQKLKLKSTIFVALLLIATGMVGIKVAVPPANAVHGGNPAIVALWNENAKSNVVLDSGLSGGSIIVYDINVTDAGQLKGFDITVTYSPLIIRPLVATDIAYNGAGCPAAEGCLFDGISTLQLLKQVDTPTGQSRLSVTITAAAYAAGTGTLFRIRFTVQSEGASMINIVEGVSTVLNPGSVPYQGIDGYLDTRANNSQDFEYTMVASPTSVTVNRPVSGTAPGSVTITLTFVRGTTRPVAMRLLSIPQGVTASFSPTSGTPNFSTTLSLTINGGPAGGATTAPSGTFKLAITGNSTVPAGHFVKETWLTLIIVPPPPPNYTMAASPTSISIHQGGWATVAITLTLISGTPETVLLSSNIGSSVCGTATFSPQNPIPTATVTMNITLCPTADTNVPLKKFNITGTSVGTYSETSVVRLIQNYEITVVPFDFQIDSMATLAFNGVASRSFAYYGVTSNPITVPMGVTNQGGSSGTVTITAKASNATHIIIIGTTTVTIGSLQTMTVTFNWNAHLLKRGVYAVWGETRLADPSQGSDYLAVGDMDVRYKGDVSNDCTVNIIDLARVGASFGSSGGPPPSSNWDAAADMNNDNTINVIDLANVGAAFGQTCG